MYLNQSRFISCARQQYPLFSIAKFSLFLSQVELAIFFIMSDPTKPSCPIPRRHSSAIIPLPRRESLTALPTSTAVDPRLQEQPRHTLGPWPLSRNVSSSNNTASLRSRAASVQSGSSRSSHSSERICSLRDIHAISEMLITHDQATSQLFEKQITQTDDMASIGIDDPQHPQNKSDNERALLRDIFSIYNALDYKSTPTANSIAKHHRSIRPSLLPTTSDLDPSSSAYQPLLPYKLHGTFHTSVSHDKTPKLKLKSPPKSPDPFSTLHTREKMTLTARPGDTTTTSPSEKAAAQLHQTLDDDEKLALAWLESATAETHDEGQALPSNQHQLPDLNLNLNLSRRKCTICCLIYSLLLFTTWVSAMAFVFQTPAFQTARMGWPRALFGTILVLSSFNMGVLFYVVGASVWPRRKTDDAVHSDS